MLLCLNRCKTRTSGISHNSGSCRPLQPRLPFYSEDYTSARGRYSCSPGSPVLNHAAADGWIFVLSHSVQYLILTACHSPQPRLQLALAKDGVVVRHAESVKMLMKPETDSTPRRKYDLATGAADFAVWEGPPQRTILLCSHPRSGSTLLGETLYQAGGWGCPIEYFHRGFQPELERLWGTDDLTAYVRAVYRHRTDPSGTFSTKLFWHDIEDLCAKIQPEMQGSLKSLQESSAAETYRRIHVVLAGLFPNPTYVYLVRQDALRQAVSCVIAAQTGVWRSIPQVQENTPQQEPEYDHDRIAGALAFGEYCRRHWEGYFQANLIVPVRITYECLNNDFEPTVRRLFSELGRPEAPVPPRRMRRQADGRSEAMLLRFLREMKSRSSQLTTDPSSIVP